MDRPRLNPEATNTFPMDSLEHFPDGFLEHFPDGSTPHAGVKNRQRNGTVV
jgi:hypothetical protein